MLRKLFKPGAGLIVNYLLKVLPCIKEILTVRSRIVHFLIAHGQV